MTTIELTDTEVAKLHRAAVARFTTQLLLATASKAERKSLAEVAAWQDGEIENVLATAQGKKNNNALPPGDMANRSGITGQGHIR